MNTDLDRLEAILSKERAKIAAVIPQRHPLHGKRVKLYANDGNLRIIDCTVLSVESDGRSKQRFVLERI